MHGGGDHFSHFLLAPGTTGGVVDHLGNLPYRTVQTFGGAQHLANQGALAIDEAVETPGQIAQLVLP
ncbi:hypothetical protein D3C71_2114810 [compost metagenome]